MKQKDSERERKLIFGQEQVRGPPKEVQGTSMWALIGVFVTLCRPSSGVKLREGRRRGGGGAKEAEQEGRGGVRYVPGHTCSLSNPVTLIFSQTRGCVYTRAHPRTHTRACQCTNRHTKGMKEKGGECSWRGSRAEGGKRQSKQRRKGCCKGETLIQMLLLFCSGRGMCVGQGVIVATLKPCEVKEWKLEYRAE